MVVIVSPLVELEKQLMRELNGELAERLSVTTGTTTGAIAIGWRQLIEDEPQQARLVFGCTTSLCAVLVTPESFVGESFRRFLAKLCNGRRVRTVVCDEIHVVGEILAAQTERGARPRSSPPVFRPKYSWVGGIAKKHGLRLICLTGTMPLDMERGVLRELGMVEEGGGMPYPCMVRVEPTVRQDVRVCVEEVSAEFPGRPQGGRAVTTTTTKATVQRAIRSYMENVVAPGCRVILFCPTRFVYGLVGWFG